MSDGFKKMAELLRNDDSNAFRPTVKGRQTAIDARWIGDKLVAKDGTVVMQSPSIGQSAQEINSFMPITGDIQSGIMAANDIKNKNYGSAALNGLGLLPFVPSLAGALGSKGAKLAEILKTKPKTQYELAHELAQKNAVDMLGLPPNNTAMDRAKALGFDTPAYHGTNADFNAFDLSHTGTASGAEQYGSGVYTTTNPTMASGYANPNKEGANVLPLLVKMKAPLSPDHEQHLTKMQIRSLLQKSPELDDALWNFGDVGYEGKSKVLNEAVNSMHEYQDNKLLDNLHPMANDFFRNSPQEFNFAAFDPANAHKADILGQADPKLLALLGGTSALGINYLRNNKK
jgi:ADP-Ribosyltransferase in polyvalent proteins